MCYVMLLEKRGELTLGVHRVASSPPEAGWQGQASKAGCFIARLIRGWDRSWGGSRSRGQQPAQSHKKRGLCEHKKESREQHWEEGIYLNPFAFRFPFPLPSSQRSGGMVLKCLREHYLLVNSVDY